MRGGLAGIMFVLSAAAGYAAFRLYLHLRALPPDTEYAEYSLWVGNVGLSPFAVVIGLTVVAVGAGLGGVAVLVAARENSAREVE
jgi:hypothetical protein